MYNEKPSLTFWILIAAGLIAVIFFIITIIITSTSDDTPTNSMEYEENL